MFRYIYHILYSWGNNCLKCTSRVTATTAQAIRVLLAHSHYCLSQIKRDFINECFIKISCDHTRNHVGL